MANRIWMLALPALLLAACDTGGGEAEQAATQPEPEPRSVFDEPVAEPAPTVNASELLIREQTPTLRFVWRAPAELASAPELLARLRQQALEQQVRMGGLARDTAETRADLGAKGDAALFWSQEWRAAYENEALMNLVARLETYEGGAHGMHSYKSIFYDKAAEREIPFRALFINWPEAEEALRARFCKALNDMRSQRRGAAETAAKPDDPFAACPALGEQPIRIDATNFGGFTGFTVLLAPYEAGPYAEGAYEVEIPADDALRAALKTQYFPRT